MYDNSIKEKINDDYVNRVLYKFYGPVLINRLDAETQTKACNSLLHILNRFNNFDDNKSRLLNDKSKLEKMASVEGFDNDLFELAAALGTLINSYDKKDKNHLSFEKAIALTIELLEAKKAQFTTKEVSKRSTGTFYSRTFGSPNRNQDEDQMEHKDNTLSKPHLPRAFI